jgi:hypothetical protein
MSWHFTRTRSSRYSRQSQTGRQATRALSRQGARTSSTKSWGGGNENISTYVACKVAFGYWTRERIRWTSEKGICCWLTDFSTDHYDRRPMRGACSGKLSAPSRAIYRAAFPFARLGTLHQYDSELELTARATKGTVDNARGLRGNVSAAIVGQAHCRNSTGGAAQRVSFGPRQDKVSAERWSAYAPQVRASRSPTPFTADW